MSVCTIVCVYIKCTKLHITAVGIHWMMFSHMYIMYQSRLDSLGLHAYIWTYIDHTCMRSISCLYYDITQV